MFGLVCFAFRRSRRKDRSVGFLFIFFLVLFFEDSCVIFAIDVVFVYFDLLEFLGYDVICI